MTSRRATKRRRHLHGPRDRMLPVMPGVIPDRTQPSIDLAMEQAHELPYVRDTCVMLRLFDADETGYAAVEQLLGASAIPLIRAKVEETGGTQPTIVIATREPRRQETP